MPQPAHAPSAVADPAPSKCARHPSFADENSTHPSSVDAVAAVPVIVDHPSQSALAVRVGVYWGACVSYFIGVSFISQVMYNPQILLAEHLRAAAVDLILWVPAIFILLPLVIYDMLRLSHRILLPIEQVRQGLVALAAGQRLAEIPASDEIFNKNLVAAYAELCDSAVAGKRPSVDEFDFFDCAGDETPADDDEFESWNTSDSADNLVSSSVS